MGGTTGIIIYVLALVFIFYIIPFKIIKGILTKIKNEYRDVKQTKNHELQLKEKELQIIQERNEIMRQQKEV